LDKGGRLATSEKIPAYPFRNWELADNLKTEKYKVRIEVLRILPDKFEWIGQRSSPELTLEQVKSLAVDWKEE